MKRIDTKKLVVLALMIALNIVFSRLIPAVNVWNTKIAFTFITLVVTGYLYGPIYSGLVGGVGDLIGALLFPIGEFNPLFTLTAIMSGVIFGIFHKKNLELSYVIIESLLNHIFVTILLNSWFIAISYNASFVALLATRSLQSLVMFVIEIILITLLKPAIKRLGNF